MRGAGTLRVSLAQKCHGTPKTQQVVKRAGKDSEDRDDLNYGENRVHHAQARPGYSVMGAFPERSIGGRVNGLSNTPVALSEITRAPSYRNMAPLAAL